MTMSTKTCLICGNDRVKQMTRHLTDMHQMTQDDYYSLYIDKFDGTRICNAPECNNPTKFISLTRGFSPTCSTKCAWSAILSDDKRKSEISVMQSRLRLEDAVKSAELDKRRYIARCKHKEVGYLYVSVSSDNRLKIGITSSIYGIIRRLKSASSISYSLFEGSIQSIAEAECLVKTAYQHQAEWLDISNETKILTELENNDDLIMHKNKQAFDISRNDNHRYLLTKSDGK